MAHFPKPFFRPARQLWYVQLDARQINLGADKDAAFTKYHRLMQSRTAALVKRSADAPPLVVAILDDFLDWTQKHRAADTYRWYKDRLESFVKSIDARLAVDQLKPHHVQKWVDNYPVTIADGSKRNLIRAVKRAIKWAEEQGYINRSPIAHMKKPAGGRREQVVTQEQYDALLTRYKDENFKDLLTITWETGCRPQESLRVEARHIDLANSRCVFPASEAKGKRIPRVIYLTPKALAIARRLMMKHPKGPLFRNTDGNAWTPNATNCRFQTVRKDTGIKYSLYALRHTWINRMLVAGVDAFTVAILAGHSDPSMLAKYYAHLSQAPGYLAAQAQR